jgi:TM2 domain-containing membrane protein YozV
MNLPQHHVIVDGQQRGPFTLGQLRSMWNAGTITTQTMHFTDGYTEWHPLEFILAELEDTSPTTAAHFPSSKVSRFSAQPQTIRIAKSRGIYILLALLFFGLLGAHNFYAGRNSAGVVQLLITLLTGWMILPLFAVAVWVIIECITVTSDGAGVPMS